MKNMQLKNYALLNNPAVKFLIMLGLFLGIALLSNHVFATDLLAGTDTDIKDTLTGTGRHWILYYDGIAVALAFVTGQKNPKLFGSIVAISIFLNILVFFTS